MPEASRELQVAVDAARAGADVIRGALGAAHDVRRKADRSPVTEVDLAAERAVRAVIAAAFPDDGFHGEELGRVEGRSRRLWIIDPLDGTKSFLRGVPFYSTQVALQDAGRLVVGASAAPGFDELAAAERGSGAFLNGHAIRVSGVAAIEDASLSFGNLKSLAAGPGWARLATLVRRADRTRGYGDFFHYHALAAGRLDAVIESDVSIYDVAALAVVVEEAGGKATDLAGAPLTLDSTSILATNGRLHAALLDALRG